MTTPLIDVQKLTTPLTRDEVKATLYTLLAQTGLPTTSWQEGAVVRTIIAIIAATIAGFTSLMSIVVRGTIVELAEGVWLTLLALYVYNVTRIPATFATGSYTLTNSGGGIYTVAAGDLIVRDPTTDKTFTNVAGFTLGAGATLSITIIATEVGADSSAAPGAITSFVSTFNGVSGTNPVALLGADEETDPELRIRCIDSLGALSPNGPAGAYAFIAKSATRADGSSIGVNRVSVSANSSLGQVTVYVATDSGAVPGTTGNTTTDLGRVEDAIMRLAVPVGITPTVASAVPITIAIAANVYVRASDNLVAADVIAAVQAHLATFFAAAPIGGFVVGGIGNIFLDQLRGELKAAVPGIFHAVIATPAADVVIAANAVPVLGVAVITVTQAST